MRRFLCILLAVLMCVSLLPLSALAAEDVADAEITDVAEAPQAEDVLDVAAESALENDDEPPVTDGETYSGTCGDDVTWMLDTDTGELTISGTGAMADYSRAPNNPWYSYRSSIKTVTIQSGVTSIGDRTIYGCANLTSVTIPDSVTSIGIRAFFNCTNLTSVTIPDSVTSIGDWAFAQCTSLANVTIPDSATSSPVAKA